MKKLLSLVAGLVLTLSAVNAVAADISGQWTSEMVIPDGPAISLTFNLKQDGSKLTGNLTGPDGQLIELS